MKPGVTKLWRGAEMRMSVSLSCCLLHLLTCVFAYTECKSVCVWRCVMKHAAVVGCFSSKCTSRMRTVPRRFDQFTAAALLLRVRSLLLVDVSFLLREAEWLHCSCRWESLSENLLTLLYRSDLFSPQTPANYSFSGDHSEIFCFVADFLTCCDLLKFIQTKWKSCCKHLLCVTPRNHELCLVFRAQKGAPACFPAHIWHSCLKASMHTRIHGGYRGAEVRA